MTKSEPKPRVFFLNEHHELAHSQVEGGGGNAKLAPINWSGKSARLVQSLEAIRTSFKSSKQSQVRGRYFFLAAPEPTVEKITDSKKHPTNRREEHPDFADSESLVFRRLGIDLVDVRETGEATLHATEDRFERLLTTSRSLASEGSTRERARWASVREFETIPAHFRLDDEWINEIPASEAVSAVIELQPLLSRDEIAATSQAIAKKIAGSDSERITAIDADFSGRQWIGLVAKKETLTSIASDFSTVQSIHAPLRTSLEVSGGPVRGRKQSRSRPRPMSRTSLDSLPCVAVVDTGIPSDHRLLGQFRMGQYRSPGGSPRDFQGDHGSLVASRVVFGDHDMRGGDFDPTGSCRFFDVMVAADPAVSPVDAIDDKAVVVAMRAVASTALDVRVFNLSFGDWTALASYSPTQRANKLALVEDLDNFAFIFDAVVVVAAGNSPPGILPASAYPRHVKDPSWALGAWPSGFNTLTCGSFAEHVVPDGEGLTHEPKAPSPFTRIGPGIARAPMPEFSAHGGNVGSDYNLRAGVGVWGCTAAGDWEDRAGTSHAAPLLSREAAFVVQALQSACPADVRPFAGTVKAILAISARRPSLSNAYEALADRTLGLGEATSSCITNPGPNSAMFVWQTTLESSRDIARLQVPIPGEWLDQAKSPKIRVVVAWNTPANRAARKVWGCRKVVVRLRPSEDESAHTGKAWGRAHDGHPLVDRVYDLSRELLQKKWPEGLTDEWILELNYEEKTSYALGEVPFSPLQRVGVALELWDDDENPVSPQGAVQGLPAAATMTRLTSPAAQLGTPVIVRR